MPPTDDGQRTNFDFMSSADIVKPTILYFCWSSWAKNVRTYLEERVEVKNSFCCRRTPAPPQWLCWYTGSYRVKNQNWLLIAVLKTVGGRFRFKIRYFDSSENTDLCKVFRKPSFLTKNELSAVFPYEKRTISKMLWNTMGSVCYWGLRSGEMISPSVYERYRLGRVYI